MKLDTAAVDKALYVKIPPRELARLSEQGLVSPPYGENGPLHYRGVLVGYRDYFNGAYGIYLANKDFIKHHVQEVEDYGYDV